MQRLSVRNCSRPWLMEGLRCGKPRIVSCKMLETWFLFTDASFDKLEGSGLGAVLVSREGTVHSWFELQLSLLQLGPLLSGGAETVIGELETLVVAMALMIWSSLLESTQVLVYIDNEGSKYSLIKGYSSSRAISLICTLASTALDSHYILPWFGRVPSPSNIADYPSRQLDHPLLVKNLQIPEGEVQRTF